MSKHFHHWLEFWKNLTRHMYSDGSGWGAEAGGIFGFSCFTWSKVDCCLGKSHGLNWKATFFFKIIKQEYSPPSFLPDVPLESALFFHRTASYRCCGENMRIKMSKLPSPTWRVPCSSTCQTWGWVCWGTSHSLTGPLLLWSLQSHKKHSKQDRQKWWYWRGLERLSRFPWEITFPSKFKSFSKRLSPLSHIYTAKISVQV